MLQYPADFPAGHPYLRCDSNLAFWNQMPDALTLFKILKKYVAETKRIRDIAPAPTRIARYPVRQAALPGKSALMVFCMTPAIEPWSRDLSTLTMKTRHVISSTRAMSNTRAPTTCSLRDVSWKMYSPARKSRKMKRTRSHSKYMDALFRHPPGGILQ